MTDSRPLLKASPNSGTDFPCLDRRRLIGLCGGAAVTAAAGPAGAAISALMCPPSVGSFGGSAGPGTSGGTGNLLDGNQDWSGAIPSDGVSERHLKMTNWATGERFDALFVSGGQFVQEAVDQFSRFARDRRTGDVMPFSPLTMDIIWKVWTMLDTSEIFNLNSGYRSPKTNASLSGAAKNSFHMKAMAADISISGRTVNQIHGAAVALKAGGVGKYSSSGFVHVDSGPVRYWGS